MNSIVGLLCQNCGVGATFITFEAITPVDYLKNAPQEWGQVYKHQKCNGIVNFKYNNRVYHELEKEGKPRSSFKKGTSWHQAIILNGKMTPFTQHPTTKEIYLRVEIRKTISSSYYTQNGNLLLWQQIEPYMVKKQSYKNQGLTSPVKFKTFKLENLKNITIDKESAAA